VAGAKLFAELPERNLHSYCAPFRGAGQPNPCIATHDLIMNESIKIDHIGQRFSMRAEANSEHFTFLAPLV